jgi:Ras family protein T1
MVPVVITDTSSRVEDQEVLHAACRQASVIVLCFRMDEDGSGNRGGDAGNTGNAGSASLRRVSSFWMPELKRLHVKVPVLLVGCKSDLRPADESLHKAVLPVIKAYPQIETCMECSVRLE